MRSYTQSPTAIFDLDNVLFDAERFKKDLGEEAVEGGIRAEDFWCTYDLSKERIGVVSFDWLFELLEYRFGKEKSDQLSRWHREVDLKNYLMEGAGELVSQMKKSCDVKILTEGEQNWQYRKIRETGLMDEVIRKPFTGISDRKRTETNVFVVSDKLESLKGLVRAEQNQNGLVLIDDKPEVINKVSELNPAAKLVWVEYGCHADKNELKVDSRLIKVSSLRELRSRWDYPLEGKKIRGEYG